MSGIVGAYSLKEENVAAPTYGVLFALHHRGEAAAGIAIAKKRIIPYVSEGQIGEVINPVYDLILETSPHAAVAHTLYETKTPKQPIKLSAGKRTIAFSMDGHVLDIDKKSKNSRVFAERFAGIFAEGSFTRAADIFMSRYSGRGGYSITSLIEEDNEISLVALRDPKGVKPLCLGKKGDTYVIASEDCALNDNQVEFERDVRPGELIVVNQKDGFKSYQIREEKPALCMFEYIYFGDIASTIDGIEVAKVRYNLGRLIAEKYPVELDVIGASPNSGRGVAAGIAETLGVPNREVLEKKVGAPRTFQMEDKEERVRAVRHKFRAVRFYVRGKRVGVPEDSIVKANVLVYGVIPMIKEAGAKEIHIFVSCPPLIAPCFKNVGDFRIAAEFRGGTVEEIGRKVAQKIGADSVHYSTMEMVEEALGLEGLCLGCLNMEYPVSKMYLPTGSGLRSSL